MPRPKAWVKIIGAESLCFHDRLKFYRSFSPSSRDAQRVRFALSSSVGYIPQNPMNNFGLDIFGPPSRRHRRTYMLQSTKRRRHSMQSSCCSSEREDTFTERSSRVRKPDKLVGKSRPPRYPTKPRVADESDLALYPPASLDAIDPWPVCGLLVSTIALVRAVFLIALIGIFPAVSAQGFAGTITLNSSRQGSTAGVGSGGFENFDVPNVGGGGQVYFTFEVPEGPALDVSLSTCEAASFDTYVALFSGEEPDAGKVLGENNNDPSCEADGKRSKIIATLKPGTFAVLVTGTGLTQGTFTLSVTASEAGVPWSLDRIDQRKLPLDGRYTVSEEGAAGEGITVYVLDSGIRGSHAEFEGRVRQGFDFVKDKPATDDCTGFGTHAAGIIAGKTHGVAKKAELVSVPILDCQNQATTARVTGALEWIILDVQSQPQKQIPAIIYMRFHAKSDPEVDKAVKTIVNFGIPVISPAGDENKGDYCSTTSPATADTALMVGSTDSKDYRSTFSNYGSCTNLYAPGDNIESASYTGDTAYTIQSGTALAAAHVAGVTSILMSMNRGVKPRDMRAILTSLGTVEVVRNATGSLQPGEQSSSKDKESARLLFVRAVPRVADAIPAEGSVFVYYVLKYSEPGNRECDSLTTTKKWLEILDIPETSLTPACFNSSSTQSASDETPQAIYRVLSDEKSAASTSANILSAIRENKDDTTKKLGLEFDVIEEPWFVDSNAFTFWGEPQFGAVESVKLTPGAIVGIVVAAVLIVVVILMISYAVYRHCVGADDIESMEGSADFEKGPVHFDDFENAKQGRESTASAVGRSFRNVFDGIGRSLSMRGGGGMSRQNSRRGGPDVSGQEISRMDSYVGEVRGADKGGGTDILRMKSYGGEAFAGLGGIQRSSSMMSQGPPPSPSGGGSGGAFGPDQRMASFRGPGQMMGGLSRQNSEMGLPRMDSSSEASMGDVRMHSMGGEAFAMIAGESNRRNGGGASPIGRDGRTNFMAFGGSDGTRSGGKSGGSDEITHRTSDASGAEALAPVADDPDREPSFFGTRRNGPAVKPKERPGS